MIRRRFVVDGGRSLLTRLTPAPLECRRTAIAGFQTIQAIPRELTSPRLAKKERAQGRIPSVVLTPGEAGAPATRKQLLTTDSKQIQSILEKSPFFLSTRFNLQVRAGAGSAVVLHSGTVLPIKVHKNEAGEVLNLVMAWADKGSALKVYVPVAFKGAESCPGLKKGGYLQKIRPSLKFLCPTEHIPQKIEVHLSNLDIGDSVSVTAIKIHPSLKLLNKNVTTPICKILATKPAKAEEKAPIEATQTPES